MKFQKGGQKNVKLQNDFVCNQKGESRKRPPQLISESEKHSTGQKESITHRRRPAGGDLTTCLGWQDTDGLGITLATKLTDVINETMTDPMVGILHHEEGVDLVPANLELSAMEFNLERNEQRNYTQELSESSEEQI